MGIITNKERLKIYFVTLLDSNCFNGKLRIIFVEVDKDLAKRN